MKVKMNIQKRILEVDGGYSYEDNVLEGKWVTQREQQRDSEEATGESVLVVSVEVTVGDPGATTGKDGDSIG